MKSLKAQNVARADYKKRNFKEAEVNSADDFQQSGLPAGLSQRILPANVLKLQRIVGNQAVQRLLISRMANAAKIQREPTAIDSNVYYDTGTNIDGILTVTITNPDIVNAEITSVAIVATNSDKTDIPKKHTKIKNDGNSVTITVDLKKAKLDTVAKTIMFTIGGSSRGDAGQQQGDDASNSGTQQEFPPVKTQEEFITEQDYRDYLIKEILARGAKKEEKGIWKTQPYNFKEKLLQPLSTSDLVDLLTITTERSNYKAAQCFVVNPEGECLKENPD